MTKLLLLSVVIVTLVLPMIAARASDPARGLRRMLVSLAIFNVLYAIALILFIRSPY